MPGRRRSAVPLLAVATWLVVGACSSSDGRTLPPPTAGQTTSSVTAPVVGQPGEGSTGVFTLSSPAFASGGAIPVAHTCDGDDLSPALQWSSTPPGAQLAIVVRDLDAGGFVHWVVTGIDPLVQGIGEGGVPEGAVEATNDTGAAGWSGPCPPPGSSHTYELALHVLPEPLTLDPGTPGQEAATLVEGASSAEAVLRGTYGR